MAEKREERSVENGVTLSSGGDVTLSELEEMTRELEEENARLANKRPWYSWLWSWKE